MPNRTYAFRDLIQYSGASKHEVTGWVQKGLIRPSVRDTTGTGAHRRFDFFDLFEACIARRLNQVPGGMPVAALDSTLFAIRAHSELSAVDGSAWSRFLDPATRDPAARFWVLWRAGDISRVIDQTEHAALDESTDLLVLLRLDSLLIDLELRTGDHGTAADHTWTKRATTEAPVIEPPHATPSVPLDLADRAEE